MADRSTLNKPIRKPSFRRLRASRAITLTEQEAVK